MPLPASVEGVGSGCGEPGSALQLIPVALQFTPKDVPRLRERMPLALDPSKRPVT